MIIPQLALVALASISSPSIAQETGDGLNGLTMVDIEVDLSGGGTITAQRGVLQAPNVRGREDLPNVQVEFHRFHCEDENSTTPPIFLLRGGPSFAGLGPDLRREGFYENEIRRHATLADVVIVGQRGIGSSTPNTRCGGYEREALHERVTDDEAAVSIAEACRACREKWESEGFDPAGFNVMEAAADVVDVADALAYGKITLVGSSFGSHWGMTIMRFHPERVARAVFSGLEGPDHTYDMPSHVVNSLRRIAKAAEMDEGLAARIPTGGLVAAFRATAARLDESPEMVELGTFKVLMDGRRLRQSALGTTSRTSSRNGMRTWPADMIRIANGDLKAAAQMTLRRNMGAMLPTASFFNLDCGSGISAERLERLRNDPATAIVGRGEAFYEAACPSWSADLGEAFRTNFETRIPTVIVHGTWDTSTPFDNALELAPFFLESRFVIVDGGSHGAIGEAYRQSEELREGLTAFLATGDLLGIPERITLPPLEWVIPEADTVVVPMATMHLRVARPTDRLDEIVAMYEEGLGLERIGAFEDHEGFDGVMLGLEGVPYHLEFTHEEGAEAGPPPSEENLLVFYVADVAEWTARCDAMIAAGFEAVPAHNPYWDRGGRTFVDLDGHRVVLYRGAWR